MQGHRPNMQDISAVTIFCEDIRQEQSGTEILIGILPDNIEVPKIPVMMPKLSTYTRINLSVDYDPGYISLFLRTPDGEERALTTFDPNMVQNTRRDAKEQGNPLVGLISRTVGAGFQIPQSGRIVTVLRTKDHEIICGGLNIQETSND